MDPISIIALSLGTSWASGLNLYAAVLTLGILQDAGWIALPPHLQFLGSPVVLLAAGIMYLVEFVADKVPAVSVAWNTAHTFIRIPAAALLAAASVADVSRDWAFAAALIGGSLAAGTHVAKTGSRLAVGIIPFTGLAASLAEDFSAVAIIWLAVTHPVVLLILLALFVALLVWLLPKLIRVIRRLGQTIAAWFRDRPKSAS